MDYGILNEYKGTVSVMLASGSEAKFMEEVRFRNQHSRVLYARYALNPQAKGIFLGLTERSGDIKESELPAIIAQLQKAQGEAKPSRRDFGEVSCGDACDGNPNKINVVRNK